MSVSTRRLPLFRHSRMPYRAAPPTMATITISVTLQATARSGALRVSSSMARSRKRGPSVVRILRDHHEQQPEEIGAAIAPHVGQETS